jgi:hypothetical protein
MEAQSVSKTSENFYHITWCNNLEDSQLQTRRREDLKSHQEVTRFIGQNNR